MAQGLSWDTGSSSPWGAHSLPNVVPAAPPQLNVLAWLPPGLSESQAPSGSASSSGSTGISPILGV